MNKFIILTLTSLLLLSGCTRQSVFPVYIDSDPPGAIVEINGFQIGQTPFSYEINATDSWVGVNNTPDGWSIKDGIINIQALPSPAFPNNKTYYTSTKQINLNQIPKNEKKLKIFFNLNLGPLKQYSPVEINLNNI
jgi:hypothetical protein